MAALLQDRAVAGALVALGLLAVVDNVVFHWLLGWHRLNQAWSAEVNLAAEAALVVLGMVMVTAGARGLRRRR
jgi:uncharacterized membrane protein